MDVNDRFWSRNFVLLERDNYRLLVLNSSAFHGTAPKEISHGRVSPHTLAAIRGRLQDSPKRPVNVLLCHHHPQLHQEIVDAPDYEAMINGQPLLEMLGELPFGRWLVVHGHKHYPKLAYAAGGASAPVVFSAGSLCAHLYPKLATIARNQFYIITLPLARFAQLGFVGSIRAWDWSTGLGWIPAQPHGSGLPHYAGFGTKSDPTLLANDIASKMPADIWNWQAVRAEVPHVDFLLPRDLADLLVILSNNHGIKATYGPHGEPHELGR